MRRIQNPGEVNTRATRHRPPFCHWPVPKPRSMMRSALAFGPLGLWGTLAFGFPPGSVTFYVIGLYSGAS